MLARGSRPAQVLVAVSAAVLASVVAPGLAGTAAAAGGPAFVQAATAHTAGKTSLAVTPAAALGTGGRLVVEVGVWNAAHSTASGVTDAAGDVFTELTHFTAADGTEESVWSAPVTAGAGTRPAVTAKVPASADIGVAVLEYSGLSSAPDATVVDQQSHSTGLTGSAAASVTSGATPATSADGELAIGFYADSGFGDTLTAGAGWTGRASIAPVGDMELLVEDQAAALGAQPNATVTTGKATYWLMATLVLKTGVTGPPTAPAPPAGVQASPGNGSATVSWTAPASGGSPITSYTVTPVTSAGPQASTVVTGTPPATAATIGGLTNGTSYRFTVTATNGVGTSGPSVASNAVTPGSNPAGQWSALQSWPIVAVHDVALNDGKYLVWDGWQDPQPTQVWDPVAGTFTTVNATDSLFCSGHVHLPDGRVFAVGGDGVSNNGWLGLKHASLFDPTTNQWTRVADMNLPRWYPDVVALGGGKYLALSGNSTDATHWADTPEVWDQATNTWTLLNAVNTSQIHEEEYPFSYLLPNGLVFAMGPSEDVSYDLDVARQTWTPVGPSGVVNGSSVMYRPGKILYSGGAPSVTSTTDAQAGTAVIDTTAATPAWRSAAPMNHARVYHTLTMLADGRVLAVGGEPTSDQSTVTTGVLPTEIWDPATQTWTDAAPITAARNYHSTAVLMPDGRVMVAGGGHEESLSDPGQYNAQFYSPSYLFAGPRPTISSAPAVVGDGGSFTVTSPDAGSITAVNLVSLGADTHQADMDQRFVPLSFSTSGNTLSIQAPANTNIAPAGDYMLFLVTGSGVPSVAAQVHVAPAPPTVPAAPTGVVAGPANGSATVSWTAPADGGSPLTGYTVTPYLGGVAQSATTVTGNPPVTAVTVPNLTNGSSYTFTVRATNALGTGAESAPSNAVTPTVAPSTPRFLQQTVARAAATSVSATLPGSVTTGDRLVVEVGIWNSKHSTTTGVTDSAGNTYTEVSHFAASDGTEQSIWTAPVTAGGGTRPVVKAVTGATADLGISVLEYSGLSTAAGAAAVDQVRTGSASAGAGATTAASGATAPTTAAGELAIGFYTDSGFGDTLTPGSGWTSRSSVFPTPDMELLAEDQQLPGAGATPNAVVTSSGSTVWLMSTIVFRGAS